MKKTNNIEKIPFRSDILEIGFEIVTLDFFYSLFDDDKKEKPHILQFYAILFITKGEGAHEIDFNIYKYQENDLLFINKNQEHRWIDYKNTKGYLMLFTEDFLRKNQLKFKDLSYSFPYNSFLFEPVLSLVKKDNIQSLRKLVTYLYEEYNLTTSEEKSEILQCLLRTFLLKLKASKPTSKIKASTEQKELFIRFQKLLDDNIANSRNVNDYCNWLRVSYKKLNETCKTFTKGTAKNFVDDIIVLKAKQSLTDTTKSISEIAYLLGFDEPTNFTKFFKKHTQYSPKEFQKASLSY